MSARRRGLRQSEADVCCWRPSLISLVHEIEDAPLLCALFTLTGSTSPQLRVLTIRDEQGPSWQPSPRVSVFCGAAEGGARVQSLMFQSPLRTHVLALLELEHKAWQMVRQLHLSSHSELHPFRRPSRSKSMRFAHAA